MHNFAYNLNSHSPQIQKGGGGIEKNAGGRRLESKELPK